MREWSIQQQTIFSWFEKSTNHLVVEARAGTGKTTTIVEGVNRIPAGRKVLVCAFNKKIAEELTIRIENPDATASTLHSLGFAAIRRYKSRVRVVRESESPNRADKLTDQVVSRTAPDTVKRLVSRLHTKGREITPHATHWADLEELAYKFECIPDESWEASGYDVKFVCEAAIRAMELAAKQTDEIDFADMIYLPVRNGWLAKTYDDVVVDEGQDMTIAQLEIAQGVCKGRLCIVGDSFQAIYDFRGADSGSLNRLRDELSATVLGLTTTYRCGRAIVAEANTLVADFFAGPDNPDGLVRSIPAEKLVAEAENGDFILSRLNAPLVSVAMRLLRNQKRARIAGRDIGSGLKTLIRKLAKGNAANSMPEFLKKLGAWENKEVTKWLSADKPDRVEAARDQAAMLYELADTATSVRNMEERIDFLFTDDQSGAAGVITCSSVHRSKGLEANRVFVLRKTLKNHNQEELNIVYVAITRAKQELIWVEG